MKCPRDGTVLAKVSILGMELDKCHRCDGLWCDHGELDRIRDSKQSAIEEEIERTHGSPKYQEGGIDGRMVCPRCSGRLMKCQYTYGVQVAIDRCMKCHGVWLDDGELNAIAGVKKQLDEITEPGKLKAFLRSVGNFFRQPVRASRGRGG